MKNDGKSISTEEREAADASDIEQKMGHGGNMRDAGPGAELPATTAHDTIGGSGHIPRLEEIDPHALDGHTGSPGADADREAAKGA